MLIYRTSFEVYEIHKDSNDPINLAVRHQREPGTVPVVRDSTNVGFQRPSCKIQRYALCQLEATTEMLELRVEG